MNDDRLEHRLALKYQSWVMFAIDSDINKARNLISSSEMSTYSKLEKGISNILMLLMSNGPYRSLFNLKRFLIDRTSRVGWWQLARVEVLPHILCSTFTVRTQRTVTRRILNQGHTTIQTVRHSQSIVEGCDRICGVAD